MSKLIDDPMLHAELVEAYGDTVPNAWRFIGRLDLNVPDDIRREVKLALSRHVFPVGQFYMELKSTASVASVPNWEFWADKERTAITYIAGTMAVEDVTDEQFTTFDPSAAVYYRRWDITPNRRYLLWLISIANEGSNELITTEARPWCYVRE